MNSYQVLWGDGSKTVHLYPSEVELRKDLGASATRVKATIISVELVRRGVVPFDLTSGTCES